MFLETRLPELCVVVVSPSPLLVASLLLTHPWLAIPFLVRPHSSSSSMLSSSETAQYLNLSPVMPFPADESPVFSRKWYNSQVPDLAFGSLNLILFCRLIFSFFQTFSSVIL